MGEQSDRLERLVIRALDGELSDDQRLELDRELIRNPEARRMMDEYGAVDTWARDALDELVPTSSPGRGNLQLQPALRRRGWRMRAYWLVPGAMAAALLALLMPRPAMERPGVVPVPTAAPQAAWPAGDAELVQPVGSRPTVRRATGRDLVGVVAEDGNVYWIEVERSRTVRFPYGPSGSAANRL